MLDMVDCRFAVGMFLWENCPCLYIFCMGEKIYNGFAVLPLVEEVRREDTNLW